MRSRWARLPPMRSCEADTACSCAAASVQSERLKAPKALREGRHRRPCRALGALDDLGQRLGIARERMRQRAMHVGEGDAGRGKPLRGVPAELAPQLGVARLAGHLRAQQERGGVGERVDRRPGGDAGAQVRAVEAPRILGAAELQLPQRDVPAQMAVQQALLRIVGPPLLEVGEPRPPLAGFVVDVGADVGAVGVARMTASDRSMVDTRTFDLADLDLGEGVRARRTTSRRRRRPASGSSSASSSASRPARPEKPIRPNTPVHGASTMASRG